MMQEIIDIPWALIAPVLVIQFILMVVALIDLLKIHATRGPKWLWLVIIVVISLFGPIAYFIGGRKQS